MVGVTTVADGTGGSVGEVDTAGAAGVKVGAVIAGWAGGVEEQPDTTSPAQPKPRARKNWRREFNGFISPQQLGTSPTGQ